jgi:hypothetical protein
MGSEKIKLTPGKWYWHTPTKTPVFLLYTTNKDKACYCLIPVIRIGNTPKIVYGFVLANELGTITINPDELDY